MRRIEFRTMVWSSLFALILSMAGPTSSAFAQGTGDAAGVQQEMEQDTREDNNWGWLGLLGLAGLLGMRRRDREHHHVNHVDTTRTTRP